MKFDVKSGQQFDAELCREAAMLDLCNKFETLLIAKADAVNACVKYLQAEKQAGIIDREEAKRTFNKFKEIIK